MNYLLNVRFRSIGLQTPRPATLHCAVENPTMPKTETMDDEKYICLDCVQDVYIRNFVNTSGNKENSCTYCHGDDVTVTLEEIADMMHEVLEKYYSSHIDEYYREGEPAEIVISDELGVGENISKDILEILCDKHNDYESFIYGKDYMYVRNVFSVGEFNFTWDKLKTSLRTKTRFFNDDLRTFLDSIFSGIETMRLETGATVHQLDENYVLYRARIFEDYRDVEAALAHPARNFGPPPSRLATSGRMNPHGVPVFYGAASRETAIAEVRPAVGSLVVVAPFRPRRLLNLLDLSGLERLADASGSLFDPATQHRIEVTSFLRTLAHKLTIPVFGRTKESQYLITQAVAEYLSLSETLNLDGIMFHSTQSELPQKKEEKDYNVVLFSKSSGVKDAQKNAPKFGVSMFENIEYAQWSIAPTIFPVEEDNNNIFHIRRSASSIDPSTLEIDAGGLEIHTVTAVQFGTVPQRVLYRNEKPTLTLD